MPAIVVLIGTVLLAVAERVALRVATSLGVGVIAFAGMSALLENVKDAVMGSLTGDVAAILGLLGIGVALNVIFSAYVVKFTLAGLSPEGVIRRFGAK
jgi:hypothetical protein